MHDAKCTSIRAYHTAHHNLYPPGWEVVRKSMVQQHPFCAFCDTKTKWNASLQVHHVAPIHLHPELALDPGNLIVLCPLCHFAEGHVGDFEHGYDLTIRNRAGSNLIAIHAARTALGLTP